MSLQQVWSSPVANSAAELPATATVQAADDLLKRRGSSTSNRIRLPYGESRLNPSHIERLRNVDVTTELKFRSYRCDHDHTLISRLALVTGNC
jgi:hypothetical protein